MENVKALGELSKWKDVRERYLKKASDLGYSCHYFVSVSYTHLDVYKRQEDDNPLALKSDFILSFCELAAGGRNGLEPVQKTVIDRAVRKMCIRDSS